jgi:hypothetical protein
MIKHEAESAFADYGATGEEGMTKRMRDSLKRYNDLTRRSHSSFC